MRGRSTRDELVARLRTVWPDPIPIGVSRMPTRSSERSEEYLVLPTMSHPVFLVPADRSGAAGALARSDDGQRAPALRRALEAAHRHGVLRRAPGIPRVVVPGTQGLVAVVRRLVPEADAVVVRLGRRRHGRAVVLQAIDAQGRSLAFAKCARGDGADRLSAERDRLHELADRPVPGITSPPVLGWVYEDDAAVLSIGALSPSAPPSSNGIPVDAMRALATRVGSRPALPFAQTPLAKRLAAEATTLAATTHEAAWVVDHVRGLVSSRGTEPVTTASWHGDWVPWNMVRVGDEVLLWDWEHYEDDVLAGFDHLHYLAQTRRLRDGTDAEAENAWLADARHALASAWGLSEQETEITISAYLAAINLRFIADRLGDPAGQTDRQGWARPLVERLIGGDS